MKNTKRMEIEGKQKEPSKNTMNLRKKIKKSNISDEEEYIPQSDFRESSSSVSSNLEESEFIPKIKHMYDETKDQHKSLDPAINVELPRIINTGYNDKMDTNINPSDSISQVTGTEYSGKRPRKRLSTWNDIISIQDEKGLEKFQCTICKKQTYSVYTSTSILKQHNEKCKLRISILGKKDKITNFFPKLQTEAFESFSTDNAHELTVNLIIKNHLPFSFT
jgi:hypothetical protein